MPSLQQTQKLAQHLSPQQILQSSILQLNSLMLEARILGELEQNPALEMEELEAEPESAETDDSSDEIEDEIDWDEILNSPDDYKTTQYEDYSKDEVDVQLAATEDFIERLRQQLMDLDLSERDLMIADELLGNISGEGYLTIDPVLIAERMGVEEDIVEDVRRQVMHLQPPGVGALDLQECLVAQLDVKGENGLALSIVRDYFEDFANRRYQRIIRALGCAEEDLQAAMDLISRLNPKPGMGEDVTVSDEYIVPDILVDEVNGEWVITLNDSSLPELRVSNVYVNMMGDRAHFNTEARQFARKKVEAARWFLQAVQQRRQTIMRVMEAILKRQAAFFRQGDGDLKPMVLKDIAEDVDMDISTISRVTSGKYVQTPHKIYELKYFFSEGMTTDEGEDVSTRVIKAELQKIIDGEDKKKPLNDEKLAELLKAKGFPVARRTVAKYREQLKLPVARLRKEL